MEKPVHYKSVSQRSLRLEKKIMTLKKVITEQEF